MSASVVEKVWRKVFPLPEWTGSYNVLANGRAIVFIHINKTGGSSVIRALGYSRKKHQSAGMVRQMISAEQWEAAYKFAFVRNPWDKVVSHYHYRVRTNQTDLQTNPIPFSEWVQRAYAEKDEQYYDQPMMFASQSAWLKNDDGEIDMDFVGRFENFAHDLGVVTRELGLKPITPHLRSSDRSAYQGYYDDETINVVADHFAEDIQHFGYAF